MAIHYVYEDPTDENLCQGDILDRHPELIKYLESKFPSFIKIKNQKFFIILTQSCDLVERDKGKPKSPYITIASVKPVEEAILSEARKYQEWWQVPYNLIPSNKYDKLIMFTESLIDNNIQNYFYIHQDLSLNISGHNCAFLAESISMNIESYKICKKARLAHLKETFRAKLGWLVGSMYNRVGTQEYDQEYGKNEARKHANRLMRDLIINIDSEKITKGVSELKEKKELSKYSPTEIFDYIKNTKIISRQKQFADHIEVLGDKFKIVGPMITHITNYLTYDIELREKIESSIAENKDKTPNEIIKIITPLITSALLKYFKEDSFSGRAKIINRVLETIKQDSVIRNLLD